MDKEKLETLIIDYIDGQLSAEDRANLEKELASNPEAKELYNQLHQVIDAMDQTENLEPGNRLKARFDAMLRGEMGEKKKARSVFFQPAFYRAAAALFLVASGVAIGLWISKDQQQKEELAALKAEFSETKRMMRDMLDNSLSASQRLQGTQVALNFSKADDEVVKALVKAMNEDPNANVRIAAFEALSKFQEDPQVRRALIKSLAIQKDPVVQIALIQLLVKIKEKGVVKELQDIVNDDMNIQAVKDEAYTGILKLS